MCSLRTDGRVGHYDHDVGVGGEHVDERGERRVAHLHRLERGRDLAAAQLELLDDVADLLEPVHISVLLPLAVRDHLQQRKGFI